MSGQATLRYGRRVTLEEVEAANPPEIYCAARTCWWTHRREDLYRDPGTGLPCDPRGSVLTVVSNPLLFLQTVRGKPESWGRHGVLAFEAAHHGNVFVEETGAPTSLETWDEYNALVDQELARQAPVPAPERQSAERWQAEWQEGGGQVTPCRQVLLIADLAEAERRIAELERALAEEAPDRNV